jgi:hypothetical protein
VTRITRTYRSAFHGDAAVVGFHLGQYEILAKLDGVPKSR